MKLFTLLLLCTVGLASAAPTASARPAKRETDQEATDRLLFSTPMPDFLHQRSIQSPSTLDWTSNGCTASPDHPLGFNFLDSCHRHDFGYHNYKNQDRFSEENRKKIDDNFKKDMYAECAKEELEIAEETCEGVADVYYAAVRTFGGLKVDVVGLSEGEVEKGN